MNIGILTFHCAHNYGAVLQCYALQETLKSMGHDVEVIDYRPHYLIDVYKRNVFHRIWSKNPLILVKKMFHELLITKERKNRSTAFDNFIAEKLCLSEPIQGKDIPSVYDAYIIGSDQVWNPNITKGFDDIYFGHFKFPKGKRKYISYAVSMEVESLKAEYETYIKKQLLNFDAISVREKYLQKLLEPLTHKHIELVIDPTLLISKQAWNKLVTKPFVNGKYVLVYFTRIDNSAVTLAKCIADKIGAKVIKISATLHYKLNKYEGSSPEMFVSLIKYAECVVTTSFHGTAFSLIFNKPFYYIKLHDNKNTRVLSLLSLLNLQDRAIIPNVGVEFKEINYGEANTILSEMRQKSIKYITNALNEPLNIK